MIRAEELRIGNYVYYNGNHKHIGLVSSLQPKVYAESYGAVNYSKSIKAGLNNRFDIVYNVKSLKPIPLTEEWFLKCKSNSIFNNGFEYKKTSTGRFEIYAGTILITVIEFVHELQNLNFALLGEDVIFENY